MQEDATGRVRLPGNVGGEGVRRGMPRDDMGGHVDGCRCTYTATIRGESCVKWGSKDPPLGRIGKRDVLLAVDPGQAVKGATLFFVHVIRSLEVRSLALSR